MTQLEALVSDPASGSAQSQRIGWSYARWHRTLADRVPNNGTALTTLERLEDRWAIDGGISRQAVADIGHNDPVALLVASMVWGFGSVDYGPSRTADMLRVDDLESITESIVSAAQRSGAAGFGSLFENRATRIAGLGVAMGTKLLYFAGLKHCTGEIAPLVYDLKVYNALRQVEGGFGDAPNPRAFVSTSAYVNVVQFMTDTARRTRVSPDDVEHALFGFETWQRRRNRLESLRRGGLDEAHNV